MITQEAEQAFLQMLMQGSTSIVTAGSHFYIGLCDNDPAKDDDLTDVSELDTVFGYARQGAVRNATDWVISLVNGVYRARSAVLTFTAAGGDWQPFRRAFLTNVDSGTVGKLLAYSAPLPADVMLLDGISFTMQFPFYMK